MDLKLLINMLMRMFHFFFPFCQGTFESAIEMPMKQNFIRRPRCLFELLPQCIATAQYNRDGDILLSDTSFYMG